MPGSRGRTYGVYISDSGLEFKTSVDRDRFAAAEFAWVAADPGLTLMPRAFAPRHVVGISAISQRRARAPVPTVDAPIWTGSATTWDVEATDGTLDTMTVVKRVQERPVLP